MGLSAARGQPGARLGGEGQSLGSGRLSLKSGKSLDGLIEVASTLLSTCPFDDADMGVEAAMDYLCQRGEFMRLLEHDVASDLGRPSTGAEDAPFELRMVELMTAVQSHLEAALVVAASS